MELTRVLVVGSLVVLTNLPGTSRAVSRDPAAQVEIVDKEFTPREVMVKVGDYVAWHHFDGEMVHTVTADDMSFDSSPASPTRRWGGSPTSTGGSTSAAPGTRTTPPTPRGTT